VVLTVALLVDTGPLYALVDESDRHHCIVRDYLKDVDEVLVVPFSILPELCYLLGKYLGRRVEAQVVSSLAAGEGGFRLENLTAGDLARSAELIDRYSDSKVGFVDTSLVAVAERLKITRVLTLDRRHFTMFRPNHCSAFEIVPEG